MGLPLIDVDLLTVWRGLLAFLHGLFLYDQ